MRRTDLPSLGQSKVEIDFLARPAKELILPGVVCGECQQDQGKLVFNADGTGIWSCITTNWDEHRTATWYTDFTLLDTAGRPLFGIGPFHSLCMEPRSPAHAYPHICIRHFDFPTAYFAEIVSASQNYGCHFGVPVNNGHSRPAKSTHWHHPTHSNKPLTKTGSSYAEAAWSALSAFSTR